MDAETTLGRAVVKGAVQTAIFCQATGVVLDMRRAVVVEDPGRGTMVVTGQVWDDRIKAAFEADERHTRCTVYDGRKLFKSRATRARER